MNKVEKTKEALEKIQRLKTYLKADLIAFESGSYSSFDPELEELIFDKVKRIDELLLKAVGKPSKPSRTKEGA